MLDSLPRLFTSRTTPTLLFVLSVTLPQLANAQVRLQGFGTANNSEEITGVRPQDVHFASRDSTPVYLEYQVDDPVTVTRGKLVYPPLLKAKQIGGAVMMRFVVDSSGHIEPGSEHAVRTSNPEFTAAAIEMLHSAQITPATRKGKHVRQTVHQSFIFAPKR